MLTITFWAGSNVVSTWENAHACPRVGEEVLITHSTETVVGIVGLSYIPAEVLSVSWKRPHEVHVRVELRPMSIIKPLGGRQDAELDDGSSSS